MPKIHNLPDIHSKTHCSSALDFISQSCLHWFGPKIELNAYIRCKVGRPTKGKKGSLVSSRRFLKWACLFYLRGYQAFVWAFSMKSVLSAPDSDSSCQLADAPRHACLKRCRRCTRLLVLTFEGSRLKSEYLSRSSNQGSERPLSLLSFFHPLSFSYTRCASMQNGCSRIHREQFSSSSVPCIECIWGATQKFWCHNALKYQYHLN